MKEIMKIDDKIVLTTMICVACFLLAAISYEIYYKDEQNEMIRFRTHHVVILEDVINDIYEKDREYFDKNIATSAPFDSLRSLYKDEFKRDPKTITWDDMYNY